MDALIKIVSQFAPLVGGLLGGSAGNAIGSIIASKFGGDINSPVDLAAKIEADPQAAVKLLEIQSNNSVELERMHFSMAENNLKYDLMNRDIEVKDRENARQREIDLVKNGVVDHTPRNLSYILLLTNLLTIVFLFYKPVPDDNQVMIASLLSGMLNMCSAAVAYYVGRISGKKEGESSKK
jgi:hypothetical protein